MIPENEKPVKDITQGRKSNGAEELMDKSVISQYRNDGEDQDETKKFINPGHDEDTFPADANLFGQGHTTIVNQKPGYKDI